MNLYVNIHKNVNAYSVFKEGGSYDERNAYGYLKPSDYGGLSYKVIKHLGKNRYVISTESFGRVVVLADWGYRHASLGFFPLYGDNSFYGLFNNLIVKNSNKTKGNYLNLHPHNESWAIYNVGGPYTKQYAIGTLVPKKYGGLSYRIQEIRNNNIIIIKTETYGTVAIWAPIDNDSSRTMNPLYSNSSDSRVNSTSNTSNYSKGKYLNLHPHMSSWAVYKESGPYIKSSAIGNLAPSLFGGLSYRIIGNPTPDVYTIQTDSFGKVAIYAPHDNDSSITNSPQYDDGNFSGTNNPSTETGINTNNMFLNLHPHMLSWAIYNVNGPYTKDHAIGNLAPKQFGGLSYLVLDSRSNDIYIINTESFGKVAIWAPKDNDSSLTKTAKYKNGDKNNSSSPDRNLGNDVRNLSRKYLNLEPHMSSWAVYNINGPYTKENAVGHLAPQQFGGLSYKILEERSNNIFIIQTESFGRVAIWAPADLDSSLTPRPKYQDGDVSEYGTDNHYIYDFDYNSGDSTIDIKPRSYWGAQPVQQYGLSGSLSPSSVRQIVVHHAATSNSADDIQTIRIAQSWHLQQGWGDIGYHIIIGRSGVIMQGRSESLIGAHAKMPANGMSIGVCMLGNYNATMPPKAQMDSLIKVLVYLCRKYKVSPYNIIGHRDAPNNSTSCPGDLFYSRTNRLNTIRDKVSGILSNSSNKKKQLSKEEEDKEIIAFVKNSLSKTTFETDILSKFTSFSVGQWSPYIDFGMFKVRQGIFHEISPSSHSLLYITGSTGLIVGSQADIEVETILDKILNKSIMLSAEYNPHKMMRDVQKRQYGRYTITVEMFPQNYNTEFVFRYTISNIGIELTDGRKVSVNYSIEFVTRSQTPNFRRVPVHETKPVEGYQPIRIPIDLRKEIEIHIPTGAVVIACAIAVAIFLLGGAALAAALLEIAATYGLFIKEIVIS